MITITRPLGRFLAPRRLHLYGVGMAKSGTHSVAAVFQPAYRSVHEPDANRLISLLYGALTGTVEASEIDSFILRRSRHRLEVDSSSLNGHIVDRLAALHPRARFVLTVREPHSWLRSLMSHTLARGRPSQEWVLWRHARFGGTAYSRHDEPLRVRGLFPLDGYLRSWTRHNLTVLEQVPPERLLVLRTTEITEGLPRLAQFAKIGVGTLSARNAHSFQGRASEDVLAALDQSYLSDRVKANCGEAWTTLSCLSRLESAAG